MKRTKRSFDKEFKQMAVELCNTGKSVSEVAKELRLRSDMISRWKREFAQYGQGSFSGHGKANLTEDQKENVRLKKALKEAQIEREILKKAVSIFSRNDGKHFNS